MKLAVKFGPCGPSTTGLGESCARDANSNRIAAKNRMVVTGHHKIGVRSLFARSDVCPRHPPYVHLFLHQLQPIRFCYADS